MRKKGQGALVIAHFGGLITRHAINQRPELFSGAIFAGSPSTCGSIRGGAFKSGAEVMANSKVFSAHVCKKIKRLLHLLLTVEEFSPERHVLGYLFIPGVLCFPARRPMLYRAKYREAASP